MKMIGVGDNVVDCYLDQKMYYPGGNAVNVAVNCRRNGAEPVAYMGVFGDDLEADHLKWALDQEGVSFERSRKVYAASGHPGVNLTADGDRVFVGGPLDTAQHVFRIRLTKADLEYVAGFDVCHTSCYSGIEPELPQLAGSIDVSFDFSTHSDDGYIASVSPFVRLAFFSGAALTETRMDSIIRTCHEAGTEIVGITLGERGALFSWKGERFHQPVKPAASVIDTMGAGDSFIAGFLTRFYEGDAITTALEYAADRAAVTCGFYGGFGYPHAFES
ncbi:MAG: PfkB family carbohydrate kinase [Clostridia bacterium]|jgi:fructoselysine 6-kinase